MTSTFPQELAGKLSLIGRDVPANEQGRVVARSRSGVVDEFLRSLFDEIGYPSGVALVALGGYGRGELAPGSDIDLLILHAGIDGIDRLAEEIFYPLWDAKLTVGHAVRTVDECTSEARGRLDVLASMLDARLICGAEWLLADMTEGVLARATGDPAAFAARLREDMRLRHATYASVSHHLEPDLKEGAGGLRDIHAAGWLGKIAAGGPQERSSELYAAEEFFVALRTWLHRATGRRTDKLYLEQQPELAQAFEYEDRPQWSAADLLMRDVFRHGRAVEFAVSSELARFMGEAELETDRIATDALQPGGEWPPEVLERFLEILRAGDDGGLEALDRQGDLQRLVPEWEDVRFRPQRDPYHRFTVDTHLFECARAMSALLGGRQSGEDPMAGQATAAAGGDQDSLLIGAFLHDIGKTGRSGHVAIGTSIAREVAGRMGLDESSRDLVVFMVEQHLLIPDTATRRDLTDESLVLDVATRVGDAKRLAALYLLSQADAAATGPNASTPMRQTLIRELVAKVQHVLERGDVGADTAGRLAERAEAIREGLAGRDSELIETFLLRMPRSYVLAASPEQAARDFPLLEAPLGVTEVRTAAAEGQRAGTYSLTVVAADRPGLLARVAGALSLSQFSILSAQVFTTDDAVALDHFEVQPVFGNDVGEERWRELRATLRKALEGRLSLDYRVKEKREQYPPPRRGIEVEVSVRNDASDFFTIIEVGAADRIGLLYDITRTLFELSLDVHIAKVATYGDRVIDAFYVRDVLGEKITDDDHSAEVVRAITARLSQDG